jgi:hypothetical protein
MSTGGVALYLQGALDLRDGLNINPRTENRRLP